MVKRISCFPPKETFPVRPPEVRGSAGSDESGRRWSRNTDFFNALVVKRIIRSIRRKRFLFARLRSGGRPPEVWRTSLDGVGPYYRARGETDIIFPYIPVRVWTSAPLFTRDQERLLRCLIVLFTSWRLVVALGSLLPKPAWLKKDRSSGALAIVNIYGPIHTNQTASPWGAPDADAIANQLHRLSEKETVKAILLRINSPGGTVGAVQEINTEVLRCKAKGKIIVASFGDVAASGGYYLGAAADRIVADPGTITGSIGVIMEFGNLEGLFQKLGVKLVVIKTGAHKDIGSPARPLTEEEKRLLQDSMNDAYDQFLKAVEAGRKMPEDKLRALADGRIFTGRQAMKEGLVDELGNRQDAIRVAIQLAHLPDHPELITDDAKSFAGFLKQLSSESTALHSRCLSLARP